MVKLEPIGFPEPVYSMAIQPKTKGQDDKIAAGLSRLGEEDQTFTVVNNAETRQVVLSGTGDIQPGRAGVQTEIPLRRGGRAGPPPACPTGKIPQEGGGPGPAQEADRRPRPVRRRVDPLRARRAGGDGVLRGVVGGAVPKNYFPAVEKGLREAVVHGVLAATRWCT